MSSLRNFNEFNWCLIGDTNIVINQDEKLRGNSIDLYQSNCFLKFINDMGLMEMPLKGGFSWSNQRKNEDNILEKTDICLYSFDWNLTFPNSVGLMEAMIGSDHCPIILLLHGFKKQWKKEFKFESRWLDDDECKVKVKEAWSLRLDRPGLQNTLSKKLKDIGFKLSKWSSKKFGKEKQRAMGIRKAIEERDIVNNMEDHFKELFSKEPHIDSSSVVDCIPLSITNDMNKELCKEVDSDEICEAVFGIGAMKAPGPNGYHGIFYHSFWDIIKEDVIELIQNYFRTGSMPSDKQN
ncbi:hypothetical protein V6N12_012953 [Hibiscus sabdariffa]|uniref:Uncharacterized protein n=1 Tax=Hibiscus sabdariffa TaxID=183260 RepID=A0ABR2EFX5_9ROSI